MPLSVVYTTVNGTILSQAKGGVVHHFIPDPLGSVVMVRDQAGNTVYEADYAPYGTAQSETGANPSSLGYVGTLGYNRDTETSLFKRARYLLPSLGKWQTTDPLWPLAAGYAYGSALLLSDSTGMDPRLDKCKALSPGACFRCAYRLWSQNGGTFIYCP